MANSSRDPLCSVDNKYSSEYHLIRNALDGIIKQFRAHFFDKPLLKPSDEWKDVFDYDKKISLLGNIVLVSNDFKLLYSRFYSTVFPDEGQIKANETLQCFVDKYHDEITSIKYADISKMRTNFSSGRLLVRFKYKNNSKFTFLVKQDENMVIKSLLKKLCELLPGNCVDVTTRKAICKSEYPRYPLFWGGNWESMKYISEHYENHSDPIFLMKFENHILNNRKSELLNVIDIGAGKGRLAEKLITVAQNNKFPLNYILLEPDAKQCKIANEKMDLLKDRYGENLLCKIIIINSTIEDFVGSELCNEYNGRIDVVISSGGPLNIEVVSFGDAHKNISTIENLLSPHGVVLASGLTSLLVSKKSLQNKFTIHNMSEKGIYGNKTKHIQFYVLEKKSSIDVVNDLNVTNRRQ